MFIDIEDLLEFDEKLSAQLIGMKSFRISSIVHDVAYRSAVHLNKLTEPKVLDGITVLLENIILDAKLILKGYYMGCFSRSVLYEKMKEIVPLMCILLKMTNKSCQISQLAFLSAAVIMDVLELVIRVNERINFTDELD